MRLRLAILWLLLMWGGRAACSQTLPADTIAGWPCLTDTVYVGTVTFSGNTTTQLYILQAELELEPGTSLPAAELTARLEQNRVRLVNLQLFHWVKAEVLSCEGGLLHVQFSMQERWYIWPSLIFNLADRNLNVWLRRPGFHRLDYGASLRHYNFRGRNEKLKVKVQHGFNRVYELSHQLPRLLQAPKWGLFSSVGGFQSHFIEYVTLGNQALVYRNDDEYQAQALMLSGGATYRPNVRVQYLASLGFVSQRISDSVMVRNPDYLLGRKTRDYMQIELLRTFNVRNTFSYPLSGTFWRLQARQMVPLGGGANFVTILNARHSRYQPLGRQFYYAAGIEGEAKLSHRIAYADNRAFGYSTYVRGYELRVADGQHFWLLKQGLSYPLIRNKLVHLAFIRNPKFAQVPVSIFLNGFFDTGYARDNFYLPTNQRTTNTLLAGTGLGLHFVTYYDKVITFEYSINRDRERGFYIRTGFPI